MQTLLVVILVLVLVVVIIPFVLNLTGVTNFPLGSFGGASGSAGILRSTDGGQKWEGTYVSEDKKIKLPSQILTVVFHPTEISTMYLGGKGSGLWKSINGGASWKKVTDKANVLLSNADVYKVAISRSNPQIIYLAIFQTSRGRILRSDDGGSSFREIYFVPVARTIIFDVVVSDLNPDQTLLVTSQGGIVETTNGGHSWHIVRWFTDGIQKIVSNPATPSELYILTAHQTIFKTVDGGANWSDLTRNIQNTQQGTSASSSSTSTVPFRYQPPAYGLNPFFGGGGLAISAFLIDPHNFNILYVGSTLGLHRSLDGGQTWQSLNILIPPSALPVSAAAVHPFAPGVLFAGAANQLHRSDDNGTSWSFQELPTRSRIKDILIHPLQPQNMYIMLGR